MLQSARAVVTPRIKIANERAALATKQKHL
jgi:hypothetical protein